MRTEIVLDIETQNTFQDIGTYNPALLSISVVGCYFYETDTYECFLESELPKLWPRLERSARVIGFNLFGFDYPCMQRYYTGDFKNIPTIDIMKEIEKRIGFRVKLDNVAHATHGIGKSGDGLKAVEYWKNGEIEKLKSYCLQDVKVTKEIYDHALTEHIVKYADRAGVSQNVSLPIVPPSETPKKALNLSLGL